MPRRSARTARRAHRTVTDQIRHSPTRAGAGTSRIVARHRGQLLRYGGGEQAWKEVTGEADSSMERRESVQVLRCNLQTPRTNGVALPRSVGARDRNERLLSFQPKVSLVSRACVGRRGAAPCMHPTCVIIPPMAFIPVAENTAVIKQRTWILLETGR